MQDITSEYIRKQLPPIFIVDEANTLKTILRDQDGQVALESLFEWFILHAKEKGSFHVMLLSSAGLFDEWVGELVGASKYTTYVV